MLGANDGNNSGILQFVVISCSGKNPEMSIKNQKGEIRNIFNYCSSETYIILNK